MTYLHRRLVHRRLLDHRRGGQLHRRRQLRHRRQPGRQRQLQRRSPGPADRHGRPRPTRPSPSPRPPRPPPSGAPTYTLAATGGASGNPVTYPSTPPPPAAARSPPGWSTSPPPAAASSTPTRPATPTTTPLPRSSRPSTVGKGAQTVTFTSTAPAATVGGATYTPTATATSGLAVTITIDASSTAGCSIAGGVVSFTAAGSCVIDANQAGNTNYNAAAQVQQTVDGRQGRPDDHLHLDEPGLRHGRRRHLHADGHRHLGPDRDHHHRRLVDAVCTARPPGWSPSPPPAPASSTPTRPATPTTTPPPRSSSVAVWADRPDHHLHLDRPGRHRGRGHLHPDGHRHLGAGRHLHHRRLVHPGACSITAGVVSFTGAGSCIVDANQAGNATYAAAPQVQQTVDRGQGHPDHHPHLDGPDRRRWAGPPTPRRPPAAPRANPVTISIDASSTAVARSPPGWSASPPPAPASSTPTRPATPTTTPLPRSSRPSTVAKATQTITFTSTAPASHGRRCAPTPRPPRRRLGPDPVTITIDASSTAVPARSPPAWSASPPPAAASSTPTRPATPTTTPPPRSSRPSTVGQGHQTITFTSTAPAATVGGATYTPTATGGPRATR